MEVCTHPTTRFTYAVATDNTMDPRENRLAQRSQHRDRRAGAVDDGHQLAVGEEAVEDPEDGRAELRGTGRDPDRPRPKWGGEGTPSSSSAEKRRSFRERHVRGAAISQSQSLLPMRMCMHVCVYACVRACGWAGARTSGPSRSRPWS